LAQAITVQALLLAQVNLSATMYSSPSEQQHLVSQDLESAAELETSDGEVNQPMQISRIAGRGLAAAAVLAVVGWAGLHVPTGKAKTISETDAFQGLEEATYGSQWGVTEQPYGDGVSPFGTDAPSAVATVAPSWSNFQSNFDYSKNYNQASSAASSSADSNAPSSSVSSSEITSVNDLTGGSAGSPSPAPGNPLGPKEDLNDGKPVMKEELDFFFSVNDTSGDGKIGPDELPAVLETWKSHIHSIPEVRTIFEKFDKNRDGHLQKEELRKLLIELNDGEDVEDEELDYVLEEADLMENGVISIIELKRAIAFWYHNVELKERKKSRFCTLL